MRAEVVTEDGVQEQHSHVRHHARHGQVGVPIRLHLCKENEGMNMINFSFGNSDLPLLAMVSLLRAASKVSLTGRHLWSQ